MAMTKLTELERRRDAAKIKYELLSIKCFNALKATDDEIEDAADLAVENLSYFKGHDFVDATINWHECLGEALVELREMKKDDAPAQPNKKG